MTHQRKRLLLKVILKRLSFWPSLGLVGARQSGKSTLLRELLTKHKEIAYYTMDSKTMRDQAERAPDSFSLPELPKIKVIDEVQKVPHLFDSIKLHIDQKRRPGTYILSGSTQFSEGAGIKESLTGRIGVMELFPFNLSEIYQKNFGAYFRINKKCQSQITLNEFQRKLFKGGMPGFFHLHDDFEFESSAQLWLETTCFRDVVKIIKNKPNGDLAFSILVEVAKNEVPSAAVIASALNKDSRIISKYLEAFCQIFVLKKIMPHPVSIGKDLFVIIDSGLCRILGGSESNILKSHVMNEFLSFYENSITTKPQLYYYQSSKKSHIPFILEWKNKKELIALSCINSEVIKKSDFGSFSSFNKKINPTTYSSYRQIILTQSLESYQENDLEIHPLRG